MTDETHRIDKSVKYDLSHSIGHIHEHGLDYDSDIIYLIDDIDRDSMKQFIKNINILQRKDKCETILIHMSTCGGCWDSGIEIYNAIKACPKTVVVLGGYLYSMGSVILQAADKRVLYKESKLMIHDGCFTFEGTTKQAETEVEQLKNAKKDMRRIFLDTMKEAD
ncbi:ATP-dependent Clp protease proteolytic subunit, partial [Nocardia mangyaensis]|uniref:ATP-dependent Clp protease proteolytic subunit n=1 Tax=Nocardia mangyaensis TaxID=2213200 RepID=UPI00267560D6